LLTKFCEQINLALLSIDAPEYEGYLFEVYAHGEGTAMGVTLYRDDDHITDFLGLCHTGYEYESRLSILYLQHLIRQTCMAFENGTIMDQELRDRLQEAAATMHADPRHRS
jgi:hypothetical protein